MKKGKREKTRKKNEKKNEKERANELWQVIRSRNEQTHNHYDFLRWYHYR